MKKIVYGTDSKFAGLNLSQEQLKDGKRYKGIIGEKTAVKMYYNLTEEQLKLYYRIHNIFYKQVNDVVFGLDKGVEIEGNNFKKVRVKVLKLKDNFITYAKLLNKVKKGLLDKNVEIAIVSLQDYVKGANLATTILKLLNDMENELIKGPGEININKYENLSKKINNLELLQDFVINKLTKEYFPYYRLDGGPQISSDNIKYYVENNELVVYITDVGGEIEKLLEDYKFN